MLKTVRVGSDSSQVVLGSSKYNLAGELIYQTNALGGVTSYTETVNGSTGERTRTITYPDGGTREELYYRDGRLEKLAGSAVHPARYEYGIQSWMSTADVDDYNKRYTLEVKLDSAGSDSSEWTLTITDMAGRTFKTYYSDPTSSDLSDNPNSKSFFNSKGQLWKQRDPDGIVTIYKYNAKGELSQQGTDVDQDDDLLAVSSPDRITATTNYTAVAHGATNNVSESRAIAETGEVLLSRTESSLDGSRSWQTVFPNPGVEMVSSSRTVFAGGGYRYQTNVAADGSYTLSTFLDGRLVTTKRCDSANTQLALTSYGYDSHGRQNAVTDARNGTTVYTFTNADLVATVTTPSPGTIGSGPQVTRTYYNNNLQATNVVQPDGQSVTSEFYPNGLLKRTYGARTYPVGYGYDSQGRMTKMTNWSGFATGSGARVTTWNYNQYRGWLDNKRYPDNKGPDYEYSAAGRLTKRTWARPGSGGSPLETVYAYGTSGTTAHGDLVSVTYNNDPQSTPGVTYTYDRRGRQTTILQGSTTTSFGYNDANQVLVETNGGGTLSGLAVTNGYDTLMRRTNLALVSPTARLAQTAYEYDTASRLQTVTDNTTTTNYSATYSYVANSPLVSQIVFKQNATTRMTTTKTWDNLNRLTSISSISYLGSAIASFSYDYNNANQRTRCTMADGSFWVYKYDSLGQVISGKKYWPDWTPVAGQQFTYGFDDIGNRTATGAGGDENGANLRTANYYANDLNQYTNRTVPNAFDVIGVELATNSVSVNGMAAYRHGEYFRKEVSTNNASNPVWAKVDVTAPNETAVHGNVFVPKTVEQFYYDFDGNLTNDGRFVYAWDAENRLTKVRAYNAVGPQVSLQFEYDWKGRRIRKQVYANTNWTSSATNDLQFVYDGWNLIATLNASHSTLNSFTWGLDLSGSLEGAGGIGGLIAFQDATGGSQFVSFDGNGNVVGLTKATDGSWSATYEYSPFGELLRASGSEAKLNPFRFSTKYFDDEIELASYPHRSYSLSQGRWLSKDPVAEKGGLNLYGFLDGDPLQKTDPLGLCCNVERFLLLNPRWRGPWPQPATPLYPAAYFSTLDVQFVLTLKPGSDPKDCRITQYMRGELSYGGRVRDHWESWVLDVPGTSPYWWDGRAWYCARGRWAGLTATFDDSPGIWGVLGGDFPIHWGGTRGFADFWDFITLVEDASAGASIGARPVAEIPWGLWMHADDPDSLMRRYYVGDTVYY